MKVKIFYYTMLTKHCILYMYSIDIMYLQVSCRQREGKKTDIAEKGSLASAVKMISHSALPPMQHNQTF